MKTGGGGGRERETGRQADGQRRRQSESEKVDFSLLPCSQVRVEEGTRAIIFFLHAYWLLSVFSLRKRIFEDVSTKLVAMVHSVHQSLP